MTLSKMFRTTGRTALLAVLVSMLLAFAVACGGSSSNGGGGNTDTGGTIGDTGGGGNQDAGTNDTGTMGDTGGSDTGTMTDTGTTTDTGGGGSCTPLNPSIGACDPICQTGCDQGQACVASRSSASGPLNAACAPTGPGGQGDTCGQSGGCQAGYGCYSTSQGGSATCFEICQPSKGDSACSTPGTACAPMDNSVDIGVCTTPTQDCQTFPADNTCPQGQQCYPTQGGGTTCAGFNANAAAGDTCAQPTDCNEGQACVGDGNGGHLCIVLCDPSANPSTCDGGAACTAFQNDPNTGYCPPPGQ